MVFDPLRKFDVVAVREDGTHQLWVEAKARRDATAEWATRWHEDVAELLSPKSPPLVLVTPDQLFVWEDTRTGHHSPGRTGNPRSLLRPYLEGVGIEHRPLDPHVFEWAVSDWLKDVGEGRGSTEGLGDIGSWVRQRISGTRIEASAPRRNG